MSFVSELTTSFDGLHDDLVQLHDDNIQVIDGLSQLHDDNTSLDTLISGPVITHIDSVTSAVNLVKAAVDAVDASITAQTSIIATMDGHIVTGNATLTTIASTLATIQTTLTTINASIAAFQAAAHADVVAQVNVATSVGAIAHADSNDVLNELTTIDTTLGSLATQTTASAIESLLSAFQINGSGQLRTTLI